MVDKLAPKFLAQIPGATAKPMPITELSTHLGKDIQAILSSPFAAEQLKSVLARQELVR